MNEAWSLLALWRWGCDCVPVAQRLGDGSSGKLSLQEKPFHILYSPGKFSGKNKYRIVNVLVRVVENSVWKSRENWFPANPEMWFLAQCMWYFMYYFSFPDKPSEQCQPPHLYWGVGTHVLTVPKLWRLQDVDYLRALTCKGQIFLYIYRNKYVLKTYEP